MPKRKKKKKTKTSDMTQYMREWREKNREHLNAWRRAYYKKNKDKFAKQFKERYQKDGSKLRAWFRKYYKDHKREIYIRQQAWRKMNRSFIHEIARKSYHKRMGRQLIPTKTYSFYRDCIKFVKELHRSYQEPIYNLLLTLPLTPREHQVISLSKEGKKQVQIAKHMITSQTAVCLLWGDIHKKLLIAIQDNPTLSQTFEQHNLRWCKEKNAK